MLVIRFVFEKKIVTYNSLEIFNTVIPTRYGKIATCQPDCKIVSLKAMIFRNNDETPPLYFSFAGYESYHDNILWRKELQKKRTGANGIEEARLWDAMIN